ncbi:tyrosine-type recombinase/integrase [Dehalobacter sp. TeCB1]|uniref:tyrosine-type recombinase/integrase n=1 Tax=Dehalobacter sp. TeCB1 TaxID=1843715 RepID=UPI00083A84E3|nr:tyrosine-type recombinase/integrase [Dehalobacter sp. TeCB1]OCZ50599.1 recombinase XerC [Dehalobacter sp. TeCB1]
MLDISGFEVYLRSEERSKNTIGCYIRDSKVFIDWYSSRTDCGLDKLIELDAIEYKKHLLNTNESVVTANRKIASINAFCKWLYESGTTPAEVSIKAVKNRDARQYKGLEERDLRRLRAEIHRNRNQMHICIIELLLGTGLRVSELCNIRLRDIDISERKGSIKVIGKGNVNRTIPLNKDVRKAIQDYLAVRPADESDFLLIGQRGALKRNAINLILEKYGDRVSVEVTPHSLRHTLGYKLVKEGTAITTIQQILGHDNIMTTNLYTVTTEQDMSESLEALEW